MSGLAETIQYVSERAEATLAATLQPLRDDFAAWHTARGSDGDMNPPSLKPFTHFCMAHSVPHLPAKPATLAAFILSQIASGTKSELIRSLVSAIDVLHDRNGFSSPASTSLVRFALNKLRPVDPPRSWTAKEQAMFVALPEEIQGVISRKEKNRETDLRRRQNELAELKKEAKAKRQTEDSADTKTVNLEETTSG